MSKFFKNKKSKKNNSGSSGIMVRGSDRVIDATVNDIVAMTSYIINPQHACARSLFVCLFVCLSVSLSVCLLSVCLSVADLEDGRLLAKRHELKQDDDLSPFNLPLL